MTHDELTTRLREIKSGMDIGWPEMAEAADRLDRYRDALENAKEIMLLANRTLGQGRFDVSWIDEVLK